MFYPDKLVNFNLYKDGDRVAMLDIELPTLEYMTETLSGAGFAGEMDTPTIGQFSSMSTTLNFRALQKDIVFGLEPFGTMLDCRGSVQEYDSSTAKIKTYGVKLAMMILPKSTDLGKMEVGSMMDTTLEGEISYLKMFVDNVEIIELDKANFICKINGVDYLEEVRNQLGM